MQQPATDALREALREAGEKTLRQYSELTEADLTTVYRSYHDHFAAGGDDDPPDSDDPATDALYLALWDVIVDRETTQADGTAELDALYARTFRELLEPPAKKEPASEPEPEPEPITEAVEEGADAGADLIYQLKVTLDGRKARIWRRLLVPAAIPKTELHHVIVAAVGWAGSQDYHFFPSQGRDLPTSGVTLLSDLLPETGDNCGYEYESTSSWYHEIELEDKLEPEGRRSYPVCTAGRGACPPEHIGGIQEYERMLEVLADPLHPDHEEMAGWLTQDFHPDAFNIEQANLRLSQHGQVRFRAA
jgi:hypothetical protein